jgi:uncharacterized protein (DUF983 family)
LVVLGTAVAGTSDVGLPDGRETEKVIAGFYPMTPTEKNNQFRALLRQRCPRCHEGKIFQNAIDSYKNCPVCQFVYEREPGYFLGAMYFSYALAIVVIGLFMLVWYLIFPDLGIWWLTLLATVCFLPLVPPIYRYSRVVWIYFDRWAWPEK